MVRTLLGGSVLVALLAVAGCNRAQPVEEYSAPVIVPAISIEPVFTGKYN